ncbi:MAG TPA: endolytic transglycosylase MltG [Candidatus Hydrogenedentes bacterium]|nr:endolytic transglycosylase MltG [Candidatus Hydrogenedentota bacterium]HPG69690.1 endolytic transglycosylase MltG [Candidatus Hydrogenedentota bacterium]
MTENGVKKAAPTRRFSFLRFFLSLILYIAVFLALGCVAVGVVLFMVYEEVTEPGTPGEVVKVQVPAGASGKEVGAFLAELGLVKHEGFFRVAMRLDHSGKTIKSGPYALHRGLSPKELLEILKEGPNRPLDAEEIPADRKITVPEGLTIRQASELVEHPEAFIEAARDPALIARLGIESETLEGFLMPNTYFFDEKPTEHEIVERMVAEFEKTYAALLAEFPEASVRDKMEIVTIASLIEEEARVDEERPLVAAVIRNRIGKGMPLQLDSTLQYILGKYGERILYEDKEVDSPYNTYMYPGLPAGPISSPGIAALRAAMSPVESDYLYFVSNADGKTHTFSVSNEDHLRAVQKYRKEMETQRRGQE